MEQARLRYIQSNENLPHQQLDKELNTYQAYGRLIELSEIEDLKHRLEVLSRHKVGYER
jgi:hypothetical protein